MRTVVSKEQLFVRERLDTVRRLTREGMSAAQIAVRLSVTVRTVTRQRARLRAEAR